MRGPDVAGGAPSPVLLRPADPIMRRDKPPILSLLLMVLPVVVLWGLNFAVIRTGVSAIGPFTLAAMRFAVASLPFLIFIRPPAAALCNHWAESPRAITPISHSTCRGLPASVNSDSWRKHPSETGTPAGV